MDVERVSEAVWVQTLECLIDDNAINLIAVKRFFGLGPKRVKQFLAALEEVKAEYEEYDKDGIFREKIAEELETVGVDTTDLYTVDESFNAARKRYTRRERPQLSIAEAYDIKRKLEAMQALQAGQ
jgi:hypothetical protein